MASWKVHARAELGALRLQVAFEAGPGPLVLIGPNGSGKTSLLRIIAGLDRALEARIVVGETVLENTADDTRLAVESRGIGYVPQGYGLFPHLSVLDNVAFGLSVRMRRDDRSASRERARAMLRQLDCEQLADRMPARLSGGERQRVAVARALVTRPRLLLLDEPLAALDASSRRSVRAFLSKHMRELGCPSLIVTHEPRDLLALEADTLVMERGAIVQSGTLAQLRERPANPFVAEFVEDLPPIDGRV